MFQKKLEKMCSSPYDLQQEGDFYVKPNVELTQSRLMESLEYHNDSNLLNICLHWFKKPPRKMDLKLSALNEMGRIVTINLNTIKISGEW
jgi:hypothetical protein